MFNLSFIKITSILSTITGTVWQPKNSCIQLTKTCWQSQLNDVVWTVLYTHRTNISEVSCLVNTQFYLQEISQIGGILLLTVNSLHQISWTLRTNKLDHRQVLFCSYVLTPFNMQILKFS